MNYIIVKELQKMWQFDNYEGFLFLMSYYVF